jgi:GH15 family glucan-1,4-alpha-glucosidase
MALPIEDYALIGDRGTAALVGKDGSIDWLCLPRFDSPACFAALLGTAEHGRWLLAPADEVVGTRRRYVDGTALLETTFTTADGEVVLLDVMPTGDGRADVVRRLSCTRGTVRIRHDWVVRTDYGRVRPWVSRQRAHGDEVVVAVAGPDKLVLRGPRLPRGHEGHHSDVFEMSAGDEATFSTTWVHSWREVPEPLGFDERIAATIDQQREWSARSPKDVPHADLVGRSLLTLLLMTHEETGGIVAAPTTSLPECFGGQRNWDYRYCWLRDAALTLESLLSAGYEDEAVQWRGWLLRAVAGDPADLQIMYAVDGGRQLPELEVPHLPGYAGSTPVRIGNGAVCQRQNDVLGEVMIALELARQAGLVEDRNSWALQHALVEDLADHWDEPDNGIWEIRGPQRHFTHSRVMVWVAFDRAVKAIEDHRLDGPLERWRDLRERVREEILDKGFDAERGTFAQHYDTREVDASLLNIPLVGFLPGDDPRVLGTIDAVLADLERDGLLLRYRTETGVDGIPDDEHPFVACSFWLVSALACAGRLEEAKERMDQFCGMANDVGLLSEEYDAAHHRMAGNFPQAFSHLSLVQAALALRSAEAEGPAITNDDRASGLL